MEVLNSFPVFVDELLACMHAMLVVVLSSVKILCFFINCNFIKFRV